MTILPDWAELVAGCVETFGKGVRITKLRLESVPGYEFVNRRDEIALRGLRRETYEHGMPGFGPPPDDTPQLPTDRKRYRNSVPRETSSNRKHSPAGLTHR